jgi:nucleotide-binding universal stress UspA family protein
MSSDMVEVLVVVTLWVLCGLVVAVVMGRLGHSRAKWLALGIALGPLSAVLATSVHGDTGDREGGARRLRAGTSGGGPVDVVIGVDDPVHAQDAVRVVTTMLGPRLGRLTLVAVEELDVGAGDESRTRVQARERLDRAAQGVTATRPELLVLTGPPAAALVRHARGEGADLIVVRSRSGGRPVLGSVTQKLLSQASIPVLVLGPGTAGAGGTAGGEPSAASDLR